MSVEGLTGAPVQLQTAGAAMAATGTATAGEQYLLLGQGLLLDCNMSPGLFPVASSTPKLRQTSCQVLLSDASFMLDHHLEARFVAAFL